MKMASNNYLDCRTPMDFSKTFRVLDTDEELPSYQDVEDGGTVITGKQLKELIAESDSFQFADAGNGLEALVLCQKKRTRVVVPSEEN
jgi:hypothetical protein